MARKKHKSGWVLGKGLPRWQGHPIIRDHIHKLVSELNETGLKDRENMLAQREELRKQLEREKLEEFENPTLDEYEEAMSYLREVCQRRLTPLQEKVRRRVWEKEKTHKQVAKELGISKGSVEAILKQIKNKCRKLLTRKFREHLKKNHPAKGSLDNK